MCGCFPINTSYWNRVIPLLSLVLARLAPRNPDWPCCSNCIIDPIHVHLQDPLVTVRQPPSPCRPKKHIAIILAPSRSLFHSCGGASFTSTLSASARSVSPPQFSNQQGTLAKRSSGRDHQRYPQPRRRPRDRRTRRYRLLVNLATKGCFAGPYTDLPTNRPPAICDSFRTTTTVEQHQSEATWREHTLETYNHGPPR